MEPGFQVKIGIVLGLFWNKFHPHFEWKSDGVGRVLVASCVDTRQDSDGEIEK